MLLSLNLEISLRILYLIGVVIEYGTILYYTGILIFDKAYDVLKLDL